MTPDPLRPIPRPASHGGLAARDSRWSLAPAGKPQHGAAGPGAWSSYWRELDLENRPLERCYVPGDGRSAVDRHWARFAEGLPRQAHVIDLGCGGATAGRTLLSRRSDLLVTGIDWADVPIRRQANLTILPRTRMEALPFGEGGFDAAISLFGVEYGDIAGTTGELGRILKPGARFSFLIHHRESEVLREGGARRRALRELISGKMKSAFLAGRIAAVDEHRSRLRKLFPDQQMVDLVGNHFSRNIARTRAQRQAIWENLAGELGLEISLLAHLERSAKSAIEIGSWLVPLLAVMRWIAVAVLRRGSGEPIAWEVSGSR